METRRACRTCRAVRASDASGDRLALAVAVQSVLPAHEICRGDAVLVGKRELDLVGNGAEARLPPVHRRGVDAELGGEVVMLETVRLAELAQPVRRKAFSAWLP